MAKVLAFDGTFFWRSQPRHTTPRYTTTIRHDMTHKARDASHKCVGTCAEPKMARHKHNDDTPLFLSLLLASAFLYLDSPSTIGLRRIVVSITHCGCVDLGSIPSEDISFSIFPFAAPENDTDKHTHKQAGTDRPPGNVACFLRGVVRLHLLLDDNTNFSVGARQDHDDNTGSIFDGCFGLDGSIDRSKILLERQWY